MDFMYNFSSLPREIKAICDFYNLFVLKIYPQLQPTKLLENKQELIDIMKIYGTVLIIRQRKTLSDIKFPLVRLMIGFL